MNSAHCGECEWAATADATSQDLNQAMIDHYVETGHSPVVKKSVIEDVLAAADQPAPRTEK